LAIWRDDVRRLERELAYYRQECDQLGARLLRLQEEQSATFREARRARTAAKLIREAMSRLVDMSLSLEELETQILEVIVDHTISDRAAFVREQPVGSGRFVVSRAVPTDGVEPGPFVVPAPPAFCFTTALTGTCEASARALTEMLGLPYILWAFDKPSGQAVIIGNRTEANVSRAFEAADRELIESTLSVYLDVLARKRAEVELRAAKEAAERAHREAEQARAAAEIAAQAKSNFLASMSHEIRTPMTAVLGMADLLALEPLDARQLSYLESMQVSGRHLLAIINDILDFSRIDAGRLELEDVDFVLRDLMAELDRLMQPQASERGLRLQIELPSGLPSVLRGDPTRLRQVLLNLVGNGLKFTETGGVTVRLGCEPLAGKRVGIRFEVEDTGIGIPEQDQANLFDPFFQVDASMVRRHGGTGLGLAICRRLIDAMNGKIGFRSEVGLGSLFWFEVPLGLGERPARPDSPDLQLDEGPPLRVLVAEDAPLNRALLEAMLSRGRHQVSFATDGLEAVQMAAAGEYDVVLMDIQMPNLDGVEATRRIRRLPAPCGRVPIFGLTANVLDHQREVYLGAGINRILTKPVNWPELFALLAEVAAARRNARSGA
jgi:signal transduction histidine kinase/ActR/RegA family two-component response regulator